MKYELFLEQSNLYEGLIKAVVDKAGGWEEFKGMAPDVYNHGADGGFHGFIYTWETVAFAEANLEEILEHARKLAESFDFSDEFELVAGFGCIKDLGLTPGQVAATIYRRKHEDRDAVFNALAWFALEEVANSLMDVAVGH